MVNFKLLNETLKELREIGHKCSKCKSYIPKDQQMCTICAKYFKEDQLVLTIIDLNLPEGWWQKFAQNVVKQKQRGDYLTSRQMEFVHMAHKKFGDK